MEFELIHLDNGLRIAYRRIRSIHTVHCGFMINVGSRDERPSEHGIAHLIEHCLFKGTRHRKAFHILSRLDSVGGEVNAYTTKEETCVYASAQKEHFQRAAELLCDIVFSASFPDQEIEKEKSVVNDEINSYKDSPDEMILDDFEEHLFDGHALGRSILGSKRTLRHLDRQKLLKFIEEHYATKEIVFVCVGNITPAQLKRFIERNLESVKPRERSKSLRKEPEFKEFHIERKKSTHQVHAILGSPAIPLGDERRAAMVLLNNVLGGPALNSRLNLNIREKYGYCYYLESNYTSYTDAGIFEVYFGTDSAHYQKTLELIEKELQKLMNEKLTARALNMAKKQLMGQVALAREHASSLMMSMGRSLLHLDQIETFDEMVERYADVSSEDIRAMAQDMFQPKHRSSIVYLPR